MKGFTESQTPQAARVLVVTDTLSQIHIVRIFKLASAEDRRFGFHESEFGLGEKSRLGVRVQQRPFRLRNGEVSVKAVEATRGANLARAKRKYKQKKRRKRLGPAGDRAGAVAAISAKTLKGEGERRVAPAWVHGNLPSGSKLQLFSSQKTSPY
ncbi:hypothetical protein TGME49_216420 [Toxoplasma gondii ME49]|uniref:TBC1 domain-containing protein n=9 Tax=Toxoplasma gondii TaxID=5811 RepID=B9Q0H0_TOXGV|nr:hypothetical protein TGME49_216420 [Toxoplasma gondii ME49]EPR58698.1 hypothetical protein TGGT1_216420 [Toxoplasma gondii GT1]ESS28707.1 hypothetical protein TGVEG_216420 [Toxoplasma gondii VEG]KAF4639845.1 hypothetical protein TGRH88_056170 [Toxoplasma gondii]KFG32516.1 hypothetical protein TGDOM2_216420 [Toxoplasma gondii GAB2-2007-GAL-DOM2]KFG40942.1 hypothetical protein TGFOU_216420 [Toxoplasma gondii FOU]KYF39214.1 hypothetical protein TGARI_216420 [Toxoplasma gondii ARI]PIL96627.1 |eukprot:XP_002370952.1 hypothetical protein TGME49_216420 [Toxoplasma gondii ME49]